MTLPDATPRRLYLMQLSAATVPIAPGRTLAMVNVCYLVEMSDGSHILIDSGLPPAHELPPGLAPGENAKTVIDHLSDLGLRPDAIDILICTHFDLDHAGFHDAFPQAEFVVQRDHYEVARSGFPRYAPVRAHWDHPALHYTLIDGDAELRPGLTLLATPGHAVGHQSVLVRLPQTGPVLLAIDAVVFERLFTVTRQAWPTDDDEAQLRASTQKLLDLAARERVALTVFGHDGEQWQTLTKAPAAYA